MVVYRPSLMVLGLILAFASAGCGSGGRSSTGATIPASQPTTTAAATRPGATTNGAAALQAEAASAAAGDIPDNQIFLTFHNHRAGYLMKYPEGWAQRGSGDSVSFRDKNNVIRAVVSQGPAWTRASVQSDVRALKGTKLRSTPQAITLSGRPAFKVVYRTVSAPSPVTGKRVTLSVDRYYVSKQGRRAVLDLGAPVGVDNVDAYRMISESFRWS
jgi:hypothetical protein